MTLATVISARSAGLAVIEILCVGYVIVTVNYQIYAARFDFIATHSAYVAEQPPTVSRAISDPLIGDGFGFWISLSAVVLFFGIAALLLLGLNEVKGPMSGLHRRGLNLRAVIVMFLQTGSCTGMVILSQFRFPDYNDIHMVGSYLFFFSQAFMLIACEVFFRRVYQLADDRRSFLHPKMVSFRKKAIGVPVALGIVYLGLFVVKSYDLGAANDIFYQLYVWTEPALITSFLLFILLYHVDVAMALWRYWRS